MPDMNTEIAKLVGSLILEKMQLEIQVFTLKAEIEAAKTPGKK